MIRRLGTDKTSDVKDSLPDYGERKNQSRLIVLIRLWIHRHSKLFLILSSSISIGLILKFPPLSTSVQSLQIPDCPNAPWKPNENLQGKCTGDLKPIDSASSVSSCASSCCDNPDCITWQYRSDVGCIQGKDTRLGMEKDGPAAWCSDHPPHRWQGQYLIPHGKTEEAGIDATVIRSGACNDETWNPKEQIGQCFGLGDVRKDSSGSALECRKACCDDEKCGAWQWNKELGCFYGSGMHSCQGDESDGNSVKFDPFVGRRKISERRQYVDNDGKPWQMTL